MRHDVSLQDRYDLTKDRVLLNGTQALVRLMLMQKARDTAQGLRTAGYVTGYRGSPLGAVDMQMGRAARELGAHDITFQPALNEDLAVTALWGAQQAGLRGDGRFDGVFGLWYGKGPGVDRSGDPMKHANMAGTARHGGAIMAMGDDHTGESSTVCHQSDLAMMDAQIPVLSPAGVQEILDYGLYGFAMSRFAGVWAGLKLMKDTVEVTSVVEGRPDRLSFVTPDIALPEGGLNIRLGDHWIAQEARLSEHKRHAAEAFSHANGMDRRVWGKPGARIGLVASGKNWLDLVHALGLLGIDAEGCTRLGLTTYKVCQTWPLDARGLHAWAEGLDLVVVVEEKRKLIEAQVKEALFQDRGRTRVWGGHRGQSWDPAGRQVLFPDTMALDPVQVARALGAILIDEGRDGDALRGRLARLDAAGGSGNTPEIASRLPYFCSGCPHNTSTRVPEGSRAYAGIGCHFMAQWMDRETSGFTHMGGEGANWIGEAPFSGTRHVFQNIGDGTYNHSGLMAIRAAVAAGTDITYKILYNDAVAMTGGQGNDGGLGPERIAREVRAAGVERIAVVFDPAEEPAREGFPADVLWHARDELEPVMERMRDVPGVSVILYVQTCAAEKRRRRKRGQFPDPDRRIFIDTDVCEGCGDCGVQSNCVSLVPVETELGRKRAVDQSSCNKDYSCLKGFCPSFVTVEGGEIRREASVEVETGDLPEPALPAIAGTYNVVITGIGGTGVVTIGAVLAMAAHLDGKGAGMMEMAGLAQKGGAVHIHCRLADRPEDISAIRVAQGECDALIGGDLVVSAGAATLKLMASGRTGGVVNGHETMTGDFARDAGFTIPSGDLSLAIERRLGDALQMFDATALARVAMGDTIYSNMIVFGAAWQRGLIPVSRAALMEAIGMNGAAVEGNRRAFELGRWAAGHPEAVADLVAPKVARLETADERIAFRVEHLRKYQGTRLAMRYLRMLDAIDDADLRLAVAEGYHKLLSYKDEYEVARLLATTRDKVAAQFGGDPRLFYHLAAPLVAGKGPGGRPAKRRMGPWIERVLPLLARLRFLRGTPFDPFGYGVERRMERGLIRDYERDMESAVPRLATHREAVLALARLPLEIRGFGPVKAANARAAAARRAELLAELEGEARPLRHAAE